MPVVGEVGDVAGLVSSGVAAEHAQVPYSQCAIVAARGKHKSRLRAPGYHIDIRCMGRYGQLRHGLPPAQEQAWRVLTLTVMGRKVALSAQDVLLTGGEIWQQTPGQRMRKAAIQASFLSMRDCSPKCYVSNNCIP